MRPDSQALDKLVERILQVVRPVRIILFGSAARGDMTSDSDIDVLIVVQDGVPRRKTAQDIYRNMIGFGLAVDVVVAAETDIKEYGDNFGMVYILRCARGRRYMQHDDFTPGSAQDWLRHARSDLAVARQPMAADVGVIRELVPKLAAG